MWKGLERRFAIKPLQHLATGCNAAQVQIEGQLQIEGSLLGWKCKYRASYHAGAEALYILYIVHTAQLSTAHCQDRIVDTNLSLSFVFWQACPCFEIFKEGIFILTLNPHIQHSALVATQF